MTKCKLVQECKSTSSQFPGPECYHIRKLDQANMVYLSNSALRVTQQDNRLSVFINVFFRNLYKFLGSRHHAFPFLKYTNGFAKP